MHYWSDVILCHLELLHVVWDSIQSATVFIPAPHGSAQDVSDISWNNSNKREKNIVDIFFENCGNILYRSYLVEISNFLFWQPSKCASAATADLFDVTTYVEVRKQDNENNLFLAGMKQFLWRYSAGYVWMSGELFRPGCYTLLNLFCPSFIKS